MSILGRRKEYDYFEYFEICAQYACEAGAFLHEYIANYDVNTIEAKVEQMHRIENAADCKKHEMLEHLADEFMTPIEREDIVALAQELDNVVDAIDDVMQHIYVFNIQSVTPEAVCFSSLISQCCQSLALAVAEFRNFRKSKCIAKYVIEVNTLESDGDKIFAKNMRKLFTNGADIRDIIIWTSLYEYLENCLDECEDAVDIIESIVMKNT